MVVAGAAEEVRGDQDVSARGEVRHAHGEDVGALLFEQGGALALGAGGVVGLAGVFAARDGRANLALADALLSL